MKFRFIVFLFSILILLSGCETIKKKSDEIAEKENEKLSLFIGKNSNDLKSELGNPTDDFINEIGNEVLVYKTKKYGIPCERKFEVDSNNIVVGFTSSGCF
tara:strand:+ start:356 stop:658 length:303 start_codon:yes stop_codon:yes gene_type:complete